MKLGNDLNGKANGNVMLTVEDIDLLLECIRRFLQINDLALRPFSESLESARAIEKQLIFMKKDMQGGYVEEVRKSEEGLDKQDEGWYNPSDEHTCGYY